MITDLVTIIDAMRWPLAVVLVVLAVAVVADALQRKARR